MEEYSVYIKVILLHDVLIQHYTAQWGYACDFEFPCEVWCYHKESLKYAKAIPYGISYTSSIISEYITMHVVTTPVGKTTTNFLQ